MPSTPILIIAGEASGDLHAAPVVDAIRARRPGQIFIGTGGERMRNAGVELLADLGDLAVMGFSGIPRVIPTLYRLRKEILRRVLAENIRLVILVDYPGFNLSLAKSLKVLPNPPKILFYIAPQLWAWRPGRARKIAASVDRLAVVFPFEVEFFRKYGIEADFVGHPLLDEIELNRLKTPDEGGHPVVAFLPGSRSTVAVRHLPVMIEAARALHSSHPDTNIVFGRAETLRDWSGWVAVRSAGYELDDDSHSLLRRATVAAVCSGTATLEAALLDVPQVVVYKTSGLNYQIARRVVKISEVGLVNVVAGRKIVPELLQDDFTPDDLARELARLLDNPARREEIHCDYDNVRCSLGEPGAAGRVAEIAVGMGD